MRKKTILTILLLIALSITGLAAPAQTSQAAAKISKSDFKKSSGRYKVNFLSYSRNYEAAHYYSNMLGETESPSTLFKTKRGISCNSTKAAVKRKYGKGSFKKVNTSTDGLYYALKKTGDKWDSRSANLIKKSKVYVDYTLKINSNEYRLRFYFKNNKVTTIAYLKNYSKFLGADWK